MNMSAVMDWVKANAFTIVFIIVMLGAFIAMPIVAGGMNANVRAKVQERANRLGQLAQLENTQIQWPGSEETRRGVVTEHVLDQYRSTVEEAREDAEAIFARALERNRGSHQVITPNGRTLFPAPSRVDREILPAHFHAALIRAYEQLLEELNVGEPPAPEEVWQELRIRREQFVGSILARGAAEQLPEEEEIKLRQQLADLRLLQYQERAERLSMYLSRDILNLPRWEQQRQPTLAELFEWQWRFWIHSDVLRALHRANGEGSTLVNSPVKRVLRFEFTATPTAESDATRGGMRGGTGSGGPTLDMGAGSGGGLAIGGGGRTGTTASPGADALEDIDGPVGPVTINAAAPVEQDFSATFTGRKTNPLYDVRYVNLDLIVETERVPEVIDALARYNFMTVTSLRMSPADPFEAARDGYYYGSQPVSHLWLQMETVWLRSWTAPYMPASTRASLGIVSAQAQAPAQEQW